jgi:hypothetical protein
MQSSILGTSTIGAIKYENMNVLLIVNRNNVHNSVVNEKQNVSVGSNIPAITKRALLISNLSINYFD